jgi:PRTRC genetic system protein E
MTTPTALPSTGFFAQLMPMLAERTLMLIVSKVDDQHLTLSVVPKRMKEGENTALTTPLCCTGTPDELDRDLPAQLRDFVAGHVALINNLAQIQREREEAEKAAREELKKKQKTVGNGGSKVKAAESQPKPEDKVSPAARAQSTMNLFDSANESGAEADTTRAVGNASVPGAANSQDASSNNNPGPVEVSN